MEDDLLTSKEAAAKLKVSVSWLARQRWLGPGHGPKYIKIGRSVRYSSKDLEEYKRKRTVG